MIFTLAWLGWLAGFAVTEALAIRQDRKQAGAHATLSEHVRSWFATKYGPGRWAFIVVWGIFSAWFVPHIVRH